MRNNQKSLKFILISCTPDWHSENMNMSYVFTIWILGFTIPTLFIVITSVVTCAKMQQVIQKASTKLIFSIDIYIIMKWYTMHDTKYWYLIVPAYHQIGCCASYVIQKRSKSFSFGICYEHLLSIIMASLWRVSFCSYVYLEKVIKSYLIFIEIN